MLGTIHKRRLLKGVGRWGPPKEDLRRRGVDTLILAEETYFFIGTVYCGDFFKKPRLVLFKIHLQ